ncbi:MAG: hypothetical protein RI907_1153, partial [Pseudomonadota bacterium]
MATLTRPLIQRAPDVAPPRPAPAPQAKPAVRPPTALAGLPVSQPQDAGEREATRVAQRVVAMPAQAQSASGARFAGQVPGKGGPGAGAKANPAPAVVSGGGQPLPAAVRRFMEPRFQADFSAVRIHTDEAAAQQSRRLNAAAFTVGHQIFFGKGAFQPDSAAGRELIAHELTHTIQQGAAPQRQVQRQLASAVDTQVHETAPAGGAIQRLGISDAVDYFADHANAIPGFSLVSLLLGRNPISGRAVDRSAANVLRAVIELMPGGALITRALDAHGIIDRVAGWVMTQLSALANIGRSIVDGVKAFLDSLSWTDIFSLGSLWDRAVRLVTEPINQIVSFVKGLVGGIVDIIKEVILRPIGRLAQGLRGYPLLCAVLGFDPVTGDAVPRTPAALIGGFMTLIGQEEIWQRIQEGNAIARAYAWFQNAMAGVVGMVRQIPQLFMQAFTSLQLADLVQLPTAFARVVGTFASFVGQFISWAGNTIWDLLEIVFSVVAPNLMVYLRRAAGALRTIIRNPIGFVQNLVRAGMTGLRQFATNFLGHLRGALIGWLTGALSGAGLYIPQAFTLVEVFKFVASVLGLTYARIREKLVRATSETAVKAMEVGVDIVVTLVRDGPAAAWGQLMQSLSNLREMVMEQVMAFVQQRIVQAAITRLVSMLSPAGAFIQAIIAIYNTIMFFVERMQQIAQVAAAMIDSISAIAAGSIAAAANRVETTMAGLLTLVISFLARLVGLGRVSDAIQGIVQRVRAPIDAAIDRVIGWIVNLAKRVVGSVRNAAGRVMNWLGIRKPVAIDGESHTLSLKSEGGRSQVILASTPTEYRAAIAKVKIKPDDPKVTEKEDARTKALGVVTRLETAMTAAQAGGPAADTAAQGIDGLMGELATHTVKFMGKPTGGKSTPPIYGGTGPGGFGVSVGVERLTKDH